MIRHILQVANLFSSRPPDRWRDEWLEVIAEQREAGMEAALHLTSVRARRRR